MATVPQLAASLATAVEGLSTSPVRMASDHRTDLEEIASGATKYQLRVSQVAVDERNGNVVYPAADCEVVVHHRLSGAERTYTEGAMAVDLASLTASAFWSGIAEVYDVSAGPEASESPERVGNVVSYTVTAQVRVKP